MKEKKDHIFDKPENVRRLLGTFFVSLGLLLVAELFIHKHPEFPWEGSFGFFASYGFVSCVSLIYIAKLLRKVVRRDEDYYDPSP